MTSKELLKKECENAIAVIVRFYEDSTKKPIQTISLIDGNVRLNEYAYLRKV